MDLGVQESNITNSNFKNSNPIILYDSNDIMQIFRCGKRQAYQLMHTNGFPAIKIGKKLLVEKNVLEKWIAQNKGKHILTN